MIFTADRFRGGDDKPVRWRRLLLSLVLLLVVLGAGIGTFAFTGQDDTDPGTQAPTPTVASPLDTAANVSLAFPAGVTLLRATDAVPGETGESRLLVENTGSAEGQLAISGLTVVDSENGLVGPESSVDDSSEDGELSPNLLVHLAVQYPDGDEVTVYGVDDAFVPLADIEARNETLGDGLGPGQRAVFVLEWEISADASNEIQSDVTSFSLRLQLREPEETAR